MPSDTAPFRLAGNLYFVGTHKASCHVLSTREGLIMIDCGFEESVDAILDSLEVLGFSVRDIRIILLSHGHGDHSGGAKRLRDLSGAEIWMA